MQKRKEDSLSASAVLSFTNVSIPCPEIYEVIDSTNNRAKVLAEAGAANGTAVIAERQTAGRGRLGRRFFSPKGRGLYMSLVLRPRLSFDQLPLLTAYAAVAVAEEIENLCPDASIEIKWVNDLILTKRKLAGILTEGAFDADGKGLQFAVLGIGINLSGELPEEVRDIAVTLESVSPPPTRAEMAAAIIARMMRAEDEIANRRFLAEYRRRSCIIGKEVLVHTASDVYPVTVLGIGDDASLLVRRTEDGQEGSLAAGEVSVRFS